MLDLLVIGLLLLAVTLGSGWIGQLPQSIADINCVTEITLWSRAVNWPLAMVQVPHP